MKTRTEPSAQEAPPAGSAPRRPFRIMLVDGDQVIRDLLSQISDGEQLAFGVATSAAEARKLLQQQPADLALIEASLPDGAGLDLAAELRQRHPALATAILTGRPSLESAIDALRAGIGDFMVKPLNLDDLNQAVRRAMGQRAGRVRHHRRLRKLRKMCHKLNQSHQEVTKQVDVLCNDLVTAYQELASQMHQVVTAGEFSRRITGELDLEHALRRTLEFLLDRAGPTNAAVFLPSVGDEFSLGGYVNYDCTRQSADMILQHLADVVAPRIAQRDDLLHLSDNQALEAWIGGDAAYLADSDVIAFAARHEGETLAVLILFRDQGQPFVDEVAEVCNVVGPALAAQLHRIIRIHHRCAVNTPPPGGDDDGEEPAFGF